MAAVPVSEEGLRRPCHHQEPAGAHEEAQGPKQRRLRGRHRRVPLRGFPRRRPRDRVRVFPPGTGDHHRQRRSSKTFKEILLPYVLDVVNVVYVLQEDRKSVV